MYPLSVTSLCCNILDLTDRSVKALNTFKRAYHAHSGQGHRRLQQDIRNAEQILEQWINSQTQHISCRDGVYTSTSRAVLENVEQIHKAVVETQAECKAKRPRSIPIAGRDDEDYEKHG
ncbi:hypothetical protein F5Y15DRAFT_334691 [Xylariaceae sp. FL0016]|nr:hypothetical protein F5Y15DRAFT_334691 [Xylariaceae sp. FL0016]